MFKVELKFDNSTLMDAIKKRPNWVRSGIRKGYYNAGKQLVKYLRKEIMDKSKKTGRIYYYQDIVKSKVINESKAVFKIKKHQASAKGEFPANLSGNLKRSIDFHVDGLRLVFGSRAEYSKKLEEDLHRSLLKKTIVENMQDTEKYLHEGVAGALRKIK